MKKIAILRCLKKSAACAGVSCINAFYDREKTMDLQWLWSIYAGKSRRHQ